MSQPESLLKVALDLATLDNRRPRQAALRRALSTGYYALFHLLVGAATRRISGADHRLRALAARQFTHTAVADVARQVIAIRAAQRAFDALPAAQKANSAPNYRAVRSDHLAVHGPRPVSNELTAVCQAFCDAQSHRSDADYDWTVSYRRSSVVTVLAQVEDAFAAWQAVAATNEGQQFVLALVLFGRGQTRNGP